jgi:MoxR-like ATPase
MTMDSQTAVQVAVSDEVRGVRAGLLQAERDATRKLIGRDRDARVVSLALLTRQHALMLGPPGCGKTELAESIVARFSGCSAFVKQCSPYTTRDELEGPVSLAALQHDRIERVRAGRLFDCHLAVLDELFRAPEEVRSIALAALNERRDSDGRAIPLWSAICAANDPPMEGLGSAFGDRILFRSSTQPIAGGDEAAIGSLLRGNAVTEPAQPVGAQVPFGDLAKAREAVGSVSIPAPVVDLATKIIAELSRTLKRSMSDRRLLWSLGSHRLDGSPISSAIKAAAWIAGRSACVPQDLRVLTLVAWNEVEELPAIVTVLDKFLPAASTAVERLMAEAKEVAAAAKTSGGLRIAAKAEAALRLVESKLTELEGEAQEAVADARVELAGLRRDVMRSGMATAGATGTASSAQKAV